MELKVLSSLLLSLPPSRHATNKGTCAQITRGKFCLPNSQTAHNLYPLETTPHVCVLQGLRSPAELCPAFLAQSEECGLSLNPALWIWGKTGWKQARLCACPSISQAGVCVAMRSLAMRCSPQWTLKTGTVEEGESAPPPPAKSCSISITWKFI